MDTRIINSPAQDKPQPTASSACSICGMTNVEHRLHPARFDHEFSYAWAARDKPEPRQRKHLVQSAAYWFEGSRKAQEEGKHAEAVAFMENAYNHVENALAAARDKPLAANVEKLWADWWKRNGFGIGICEKAMERAFKSAFALAASSPSEQKSSLPAETPTPQEREHEETGRDNKEYLFGNNIRETIAAFAPANENIMARPPLDAINCLLYRIVHGHWKSEPSATCWKCNQDVARDLSPDAPRPTGIGVARPKSESAASAATPKEGV